METKDTYRPIACSFYDLFEIAGSRQTPVELTLTDQQTIHGTIETLKTVKGEGEFVVLTSGEEIRLDKIESINGETSRGYC